MHNEVKEISKLCRWMLVKNVCERRGIVEKARVSERTGLTEVFFKKKLKNWRNERNV